MRLKETEYEQCWLSPYQPRFLKTIQEEFTSFKDFSDVDLPKKIVFTWIVFMYDPMSPWHAEVTKYYDRKRETAIEAGFQMVGGAFDKKVEDFLIGKNSQVNEMVASYISRFANPEYTQLINLLELQYHITRDMMRGKYDQNTTKVLNALTDDINRLTNKLYGSGEYNELLEVRKWLYKEAEGQRVRLNPENVVAMIDESGGLPKDFNPYGDYEVDELKFIDDGETEEES
jgi:hypothetical protein